MYERGGVCCSFTIYVISKLVATVLDDSSRSEEVKKALNGGVY